MNTLVKNIPKSRALYTQVVPLSDSPFGKLSALWQNKSVLLISLLVLTIFISGNALVYNQEENRTLFNQLFALQKQRNDFFVTWGQLLLEESTWATQSRVQKIATEKFNMLMPDQKNIIIVQY